MLLLPVPGRWLDRLLRRRRERLARVTIYYDPDCGFCRRVSLLLRAACLAPTSPVLPATADPEALHLLTEHGSWVVRGVDGAIHLKWRAVAHVLKQHPIFAAIGFLTDAPALRAPFAKLYDAIGANRHRLGSIASPLLPLAPQQQPRARLSLALSRF